MRSALLLLAATLLHAEPSDFAGRWKVTYAGEPRMQPKTIGSILLDLEVRGTQVTGQVVTGSWPGEAPISDGKFDGDRLIFTATGHRTSTTDIPTCAFDVALVGREMRLKFKAIRNGGGPVGTGQKFHYVATRLGPVVPELLRAPER